MGKTKPTIRILLLGAPGVGKNCLESRFTTTIYPPPYDPALTLNSRRFFTLTPRPPTPLGPITRPLNTSHGMYPLDIDPEAVRPFTASSVYSNPASQQRGEAASTSAPTPAAEASDFAPRLEPVSTSARRELPNVCLECVRDTNTFMVEVINYPTLQLARERHCVLAKGEYDAVLLVYDVANRESFELASVLHNEIPLSKHHQKEKKSKPRSSWKPNHSGKDGPVVALVGNKTDFDAEYASVELGLDGPLIEKEAEIQAQDVEEREMVHPLYRESRVYDDLPMSPRSLGFGTRDLIADRRRSVMSADNANPRTGKLVKRPSIQTIRLSGESPIPRYMHRRASKRELVNSWLETGTPTREQETPVDETDESTQVDTHDSESTTAMKRQVSRLEGEALAQRLDIRVPFLETSAKTGENVEELFEAVIREVLKNMGREVGSPDSPTEVGPCKTRTHGSRRDSKFSSTANSPVDSIPEGRAGPFGVRQQQPPAEEELWPTSPVVADDEEDESPIERPQAAVPKVRRESVLRRMSSLFFTKKKQPSMTDVSA